MKNSKLNFIKSPLNYTGNKYRILEQIIPHFPKQIDCMIDLFCGGATVGLNVSAKKIIFIDNNERIINLLVFLSKANFDSLLCDLEKFIEQFNLSYSYKHGYAVYRTQCKNKKDNNGLKDFNYDGYCQLRSYYNSLVDKNSSEANTLLYLLMVYAFNNDIRFNSNGEFNLPVGKTDLNAMNVLKLKNYIERVSSIDSEFLCLDFDSDKLKDIVKDADFVYMDPPYLVGDAVYNVTWNCQKEYDLLDFMDWLLENNKKFALSNVMSKVGRTNEPLSYWCYKNSSAIEVVDIEYHYRSASYNKKNRNSKEREVIIKNKVYENQ